MSTFILAFFVFLLLVAGMAIGVLMGRKPLKGSCGGMSALGIDTTCDICGGDPNKCEEQNEQAAEEFQGKAKDLAYDASKSSDS